MVDGCHVSCLLLFVGLDSKQWMAAKSFDDASACHPVTGYGSTLLRLWWKRIYLNSAFLSFYSGAQEKDHRRLATLDKGGRNYL